MLHTSLTQNARDVGSATHRVNEGRSATAKSTFNGVDIRAIKLVIAF